MALIKCPECGKEISDRATTTCPNCGCPVRQIPPPLSKSPMPPPIMPAPKQKRHYVKNIKYLFLGIWTLWCIMGIAGNYTHYKADDWIFIILFSIAPYLILWYLAHRKVKRGKRAHQNIIKETAAAENPMGSTFSNPIHQPINHTTTHPIPKQTNAKSESAVEKLETAQKKLNESLNQLNKVMPSGNIIEATVQQSDAPTAILKSEVSYVEDDKIIARTDGKEITDDEVPYLMQIGFETAMEKEGMYNGEILDLSFIHEKDINKKEYTKIPTYEQLSKIENNESYVNVVEISFLNYINGLPLKNPLIAQKWYYDYNLNYTKTIINLISNGLLTVEHACIDKLKSDELKAILKKFNYPTNGKKSELQARIYANISQTDIDAYFNNAKYFSATPKGKDLIKDKIVDL